MIANQNQSDPEYVEFDELESVKEVATESDANPEQSSGREPSWVDQPSGSALVEYSVRCQDGIRISGKLYPCGPNHVTQSEAEELARVDAEYEASLGPAPTA